MSGSKLIARSNARRRQRAIVAASVQGDGREPPRDSHGTSSVSTASMPGIRRGQLGIPASDYQMQLGFRETGAQQPQRVERHEQVADALQPKQQDAARRGDGGRVRPPAADVADGGEGEVGQPDEPALATVVDLQLVEHPGS